MISRHGEDKKEEVDHEISVFPRHGEEKEVVDGIGFPSHNIT